MSRDSSFHRFDATHYDEVICPEVRRCIASKDFSPIEARRKLLKSGGIPFEQREALDMMDSWHTENTARLTQYIHATCSRFVEGQFVLFEGGVHQDLENLPDRKSYIVAEDVFEKRLGSNAGLDDWAQSHDWGFRGFLRNGKLRALLPKVKSIRTSEDEGYLMQELISLFEQAAIGGEALSAYEI